LKECPTLRVFGADFRVRLSYLELNLQRRDVATCQMCGVEFFSINWEGSHGDGFIFYPSKVHSNVNKSAPATVSFSNSLAQKNKIYKITFLDKEVVHFAQSKRSNHFATGSV